MRCLDKWKAYGNTYNLVQINDFSIIPSSIISASTYSDEPEIIYSGSSLPNYITSIGDKFDSFDSTTTGARYFAASEYLDVAVGKYTYNETSPVMIGTFCRELVYQNKQFGQTGWSNIGNIAGDVYYGIIVDDINSRAYIIEVRYITNHPTYGNIWHIFAIGGKANGVDVIYKTFQPSYTSNGGGATHIAKRTGQLKDLSSYTSDILMVSGGGGGGYLVGENAYAGADAGGISGSGNNSGNQSTGYAFGQGESGTNKSGGGSGLYGGYKGGEIQITPTPPSDYSYLEDTKDFKWANTNTYTYESGYPLWYNAGWSNNPVSIENTSFVTGSSESYAEPENFGRNNITPYNLIIADITDNGGTVTVAYSGNRLYWNPTGGQTYPTNYVAYVSPSAISNNRLQADGYDWCRSDYANIRSLQTSFNSLSACCQYLYRYFRHININYNGTPWIYVGDSPETEYVGGGAGSGYIGNSLLSNKKMVGYNVPTSSAEGTKTESVNDVSASAVSGKPKSGNGFVRIKLVSPETIYAFYIDGSKSNPAEMITYLNDAIGKTPAYMDFTNDRFVWGDWEDAFFIPKPCILGQNGVVQKYLNPNDYTKDVDGNSVVIDRNLSNANVMVEFPKIYYKIVPDSGSTNSATIYISNKKHDSGYVDFAYVDSSKNHKDKFYLAAYMPSIINSIIRSVSGVTAAGGQTIETNITRAQSNGTGWYNLFYSQIILVNLLLMLIGKSTNVQAVFGKGICSGGGNTTTDFSRVPSGLNNSKGLFYGTNNGSISSGNNGVKIFGIEHYYSYLPKQISGITYGKYKLCWGQEDGSTNDNYNTSATGYFSAGSSQSGWIKNMAFNNKGIFYGATGGSASTYYCDYRWGTNGQVARFGGSTWDGDNDGIFYLADDSNSGRWHDCATLSYI